MGKERGEEEVKFLPVQQEGTRSSVGSFLDSAIYYLK